MPYYDLLCTACDTEHNISASMKEKSEKTIACPDCGSTELETIFKVPPAVVKGASPDFCPNSTSCGHACRHAG